ncbi:MAG: hypothetical protein A2252_06170 [Elusimicrobia bacterium RIFOXYA2_FULL_39_19]|nr:MAG: hypothetical protein A2252_06170 [Elusimicrobia bacterium RIFOXYA2_FULL_39_19]
MKTIIIGAGITGLSSAYHLKKDYLIFEKENVPGGLCRTFNISGFTFDFSGHFIHLKNDYSKKFVFSLLGKNIVAVARNSWIYSNKSLTPYPYQANLYGLPKDVINDCLAGLIQAKINKILKKDNHNKKIKTFKTWVLETFGEGFGKHFFFPYNEKLWTVDSSVLTDDWIANFVPQPDIKDIINGAFFKQQKTYGYNASFFYPKNGGIQSLINSLVPKVTNLKVNSPVNKISLKDKTVLSNGTKYSYNNLISTMPLPELLETIIDLPKDIKKLKSKLKWNSVTCLNAGIKTKDIQKDKHWVYFPEKKFSFYRTGFYHNISGNTVPDNCSSMYIEASHRHNASTTDKSIITDSLKELKNSKILKSGENFAVKQVLHIPCAYVIYDKHRTDVLNKINAFLLANKIHSIGRYGAWKYSYIEESILDGKATAEKINNKS